MQLIGLFAGFLRVIGPEHLADLLEPGPLLGGNFELGRAIIRMDGVTPQTAIDVPTRIGPMKEALPPKLKKFPAAKQRRLDELLEKNAGGTITPGEKKRLEQLVGEAEELMVANARLVADFAEAETSPAAAVPVTVWVKPEHAGR